MLENLKTARETKDQQAVLIIGLTVISLVKTYSLRDIGLDLSDDQKHSICQALLVHPGEEKRTCFELDFINKHYSDKR